MRSVNVETAIALHEAGARDDYEAAARLIGPGFVYRDWSRGASSTTADQTQEAHDNDLAFGDRRLQYEHVGWKRSTVLS
jgi:hypothetical protein